MGAGLERFAWITMGTPTAYDCCFGPITSKLIDKAGIDFEPELLNSYFIEIAKNQGKFSNLLEVKNHAIANVGLDQGQVTKIINPLEGIYLIADHLRTLIFAISDGALPSNVGGGYNLRIVLRRIIGTMERLGLHLDLDGMIDWHIDYLKKTYPELEERRADVKTIVGVEARRYEESKIRMQKIADNLKAKKQVPNVDDLIRMYESDGITPDYLKELQVIPEIPPTFYSRLSDLHQSVAAKEKEKLPLQDVAETELLFYKDDPREFSAKVLGAFDKFVVLDRTSFYARGGGQEPDHGTIAGFDVVDVTKHGGVVVHEIKGGIPKEGDTVSCIVDSKRRDGITKHHTSTHILNSSSRSVLGSWVWQNSAFKEADHARLDITHHSALTEDEVKKIESLANSIVKKNMPVTIENFDRGTAEQKYGFRIYQGGVVPVKSVRIVSIEDFDVEACGGTHVKKTKEIDLIKITRTKRIQDGVVRLEFVAGTAAQEYVKAQEMEMEKKTAEQREKEERDKLRDQKKIESREKIPSLIEQISSSPVGTTKVDEIEVHNTPSGKFCCTASDQYDEYFHINFGEKLIKADPKASYCGLFDAGPTIRAIVYSGEASRNKNAGQIAKEISEILGGSGGGSSKFAQGGGKDKSKKDEAIRKAKSMVLD
jgi:alanyl-tRNA synthetase